VLVIPYGIEDDRFRNRDRGQARQLLSISRDTVVFLWLGRLSLEYKADLHPLLRAFQSVLASDAGKDCLLILAGSAAPTNYAARLAQAARQLHLGERLRVMEDVSDLTRDLLYGAADVFVSPVDNIQESHGLAILEAMAAGLPVVCSDWSGYRELVQHGVTGFLVPTLISPGAFRPAEHLAVCAPSPHPERCLSSATIVDVAALARALSLLAGSEELRREFGAKGRDRAQSGFRWSQVIHQFAASWREQVSEAERLLPRPPFRIERAFSHYPGSPLNPSLTFVSTTESLLQDFSQVAHPGDPAARILTHCLGRVRSVSELQRQFPEVQSTLLFALLKQGFLRIVSHASPHPAIPNP
jgi:glycosyltransferase involved in cell wall biosynthesis